MCLRTRENLIPGNLASQLLEVDDLLTCEALAGFHY